MPTDWRSVLNHLRVDWVERGPNSRRGNINVKCPFCPDDPSQHLQISENDAGYYCLRNNRHSGTSNAYLLTYLVHGMNRVDATRLLAQFQTGGAAYTAQPKQITPADVLRKRWERFQPALVPYYLDYLWRRGFPDPIAVVQRYDLRYTTRGENAGRLLIPVIDQLTGVMLTWTGRAVADIEPRYLTEPASAPGLLYLPRPMRSVALFVEGPIDALKIAVATEYTTISPASLMGRNVDADAINRARALVAQCTRAYSGFDDDVRPATCYGFLSSLASFGSTLYKARLRLPGAFHDPGEMPIDAIKEWLKTIQ